MFNIISLYPYPKVLGGRGPRVTHNESPTAVQTTRDCSLCVCLVTMKPLLLRATAQGSLQPRHGIPGNAARVLTSLVTT